MEVQVPSLLVVDVVVAVGYRVLHLVGVLQGLEGCLVDLVQLSRHGLHVGVTRARVGVKLACLSQFGAQAGKVALLDLARLVAYRPLLQNTPPASVMAPLSSNFGVMRSGFTVQSSHRP